MSATPFSGWTNRGAYLVAQQFGRNTGLPLNFYVALVARKNSKNLDASAAVNEGGGLVGIPVTAHGYAAGAAVVIAGTTHYDGRYLVDASSTTNVVVIAASYSAETFTGSETIHEAPGPQTKILSDLVEVAAGNGYNSGGFLLNRNSTDFPTLAEDDAGLEGLVQIKTVIWTASGGTLPATGSARYAVLTDDDLTIANRQVFAYFDLSSDRQVAALAQFELAGLELALAQS